MVLKTDIIDGFSWVQLDFASEPNVWVTFDLGLTQAMIDFATESGSGSFAGYFSMYSDFVGETFYISDPVVYGGKWQSASFGDDPAPHSGWQTLEIHFSASSSELYVDGSLVYSTPGDYSGAYQLYLGDNGASIPQDLSFYYDNFKVGTTRGGTEIYSDDFEGDLSGWTVVSGAAEIVEEPTFPSPVPYARSNWKIGIYTRDAEPITAVPLGGTEADEFVHNPIDATLTYTLNGIDQLDFTIYLNDPVAFNIVKKQTFIRVWRVIDDTIHDKHRDPPDSTPDFCGVVTAITKSGEANTMRVTAMGALWLIQTHFHILNHRFVNDTSAVDTHMEGSNQNDLPFDHSALMFRLIDVINNAFFETGGDTGIRRPPTADFPGEGYLSGFDLYWPQTIQVTPFFAIKGGKTWAYFSEDLLSRAGSPDIVPEYIYDEGTRKTMYFRTAITRGEDIRGDFSFDYRVGNRNLDDVEETGQVVPGVQGNYVWVVGDGGPNGGWVSVASDDSDIEDNGIYMARFDVKESKGAAPAQISEDRLGSAKIADAEIYSCKVSPAAGVYYDIDFTLGDLVGFNASKGALSVVDGSQRVYQVVLNWSENNVETADVTISADFKRKFV